MSWNHTTFFLPMDAGADIGEYLLCKLSADGTLVQSAAAADAHMAVSPRGGVKNGERGSFPAGGVPLVKFGAAVTRGAAITSDADGKAVTAAAGNRAIGFAMETAADGDIRGFMFAPHTV